MKKRLLALLLALSVMLLCAVCAQAETADETVRATQFGDVQGVVKDESIVWYGIPYAAAPVGELRWAAPVDPEAWSDVRDCTAPAPNAMQFGTNYMTGESVLTGTEDCLYLDVYATNDAENLPVLVFVHGGNNQTGGTGDIKGSQIVVNDNCVYVSLSYRLGLLGFNCLPALKTQDGATGNYAMQDLAKALDWIKANISAFGGDPENITISGHSAGGRDVMAMLISPLFAGKFNKAIVFSGGMTVADEAASASQIASAIAPLAVEDGKADDEAAAKEWLLTDGEDVKDYLYSLSSERLCALMGNAAIRMSAFPHLYGDNVVLPEEGFATANYNSVPVLMLTGSTEFSMFTGSPYYASEEFLALDEATQNAAKTFARNYGSDMYRIFNTQCSAETMFDHYDADIYLCQVEYGSVNSATMLPAMGSFHGIFIPMLTNEHTYAWAGDFSGAGYVDMAKHFNAYIANFLASGNPNGEGLTEWVAWTPDNKLTMVFDGDDTQAIIEQKDVSSSYDEIIAAMVADESIPEDVKMAIVSTDTNGRWFSAAQDAYFGVPSLWH